MLVEYEEFDNDFLSKQEMRQKLKQFHMLPGAAIYNFKNYDYNEIISPKDFWKARHLWEPTWNRNTNSSHMMIDYVRVWAL